MLPNWLPALYIWLNAILCCLHCYRTRNFVQNGGIPITNVLEIQQSSAKPSLICSHVFDISKMFNSNNSMRFYRFKLYVIFRMHTKTHFAFRWKICLTPIVNQTVSHVCNDSISKFWENNSNHIYTNINITIIIQHIQQIINHQINNKDFSIIHIYKHTYTCTTSAWWCHQMETSSALLALCAGNSPVTGEFPTQRPVTRRFDVSLFCA